MRKILLATTATALMSVSAQAATVSSVDCSSSKIVVTFDANVSASEVTTLKIGEGASPRLKYELNLTGAASGATISYTVNDAALTEMGKVAPHKAHIFAEGTSSGSAKCQ